MLEVSIRWENLDEAFAELEAELTLTVRGMSVVLWNSILQKTPQFFGRLVASWTYSLNVPETVDRSSATWNGQYVPVDEHQSGASWAGNLPAIIAANSFNLGKDTAFKLGDVIYFSNGADHGEGAYADLAEKGLIRLRAVNQPGEMVARTMDWASVHYSNISSDQSRRLSTKVLGDIYANPDS